MDRLPNHERLRIVAWSQHVRHRRALRTVLDAFRAAQIEALPVKGIVSAQTLYTDVADRLITDVDLLIRPADFDRVLRLANRENWRVLQRMRAYCNVVFVAEGVCVDAQGFVAAPWLSSLCADEMIDRARRSEALGFPHLLPDFDDHAVLLLLNLFKDKLIHAFTWAIRDLEHLPARQEFDAKRLAARLEQVSASCIGWIVADWLRHECGIAAWSDVRDLIGRRPPRPLFVASVRALREMHPRGALALRILSRAATDDPLDRIRAIGRMMWWQGEAWASRWTDAPFQRQSVATLEGTFLSERTHGAPRHF